MRYLRFVYLGKTNMVTQMILLLDIYIFELVHPFRSAAK